ncbi:UNVERIFIED_CONTAM: hypothetical protein NCL1_09456 [Trichonephila clavipes]
MTKLTFKCNMCCCFLSSKDLTYARRSAPEVVGHQQTYKIRGLDVKKPFFRKFDASQNTNRDLRSFSKIFEISINNKFFIPTNF